jgi:CheY-like chemotaxis protein
MTRQCILFVDDDVWTQWVMTEVLTQSGYDVVSACRGIEAIALLEDAPAFDLLLTDVDLPDSVSAAELCEHWHHALPDCPIVYMGTANGRMSGLLNPHETFLQKPFGADRLLETIDAVLEDAYFKPFLPPMARRIHHVH